MTRECATEQEYKADTEDSVWDLTDLSALTAGRQAAPEFPTEVLGEFWGDWATTKAAQASAPVDYVACSLLAAGAAAIGNSCVVSPWPGWGEPSVIWMALVGNPSSGKSPALDVPLDLLRKLEAELGVNFSDKLGNFEAAKELAKIKHVEWEKTVKAAAKNDAEPPPLPQDAMEPDKPVRPRLCLSDTTPEALGRLLAAHPKGLLCYRDELSGLLGNFDRYGGGGERAMWLEAFQARPYTIDRVKHSEPIVIPRLSLGVVGGIQPDRLTSTLLAGDDDGMAARFLYCWPDPVLPERPKPTAYDPRPLDALRRLQNLRMGADDSGKLIPITVRLSDDAATLLQKFRLSNHAEAQTASGLYACHVGKFPGLVARLALVLAFLKWSVEGGAEPSDIGQEAVGYAAHLVDDYFKPMAMRAFGDAALPEADRHAATIAKRIVKEQDSVINASDIRRLWKLPGLRDAQKVAAALKVLEEAQCIRKNPTRSGATTGRQKSDYNVSPKLLAEKL